MEAASGLNDGLGASVRQVNSVAQTRFGAELNGLDEGFEQCPAVSLNDLLRGDIVGVGRYLDERHAECHGLGKNLSKRFGRVT